jgi:hypothetical protein
MPGLSRIWNNLGTPANRPCSQFLISQSRFTLTILGFVTQMIGVQQFCQMGQCWRFSGTVDIIVIPTAILVMTPNA